MSRRIFKDIEEAIAREVRRITFHDNRTLSETVLEETFDPVTGEIIQVPIEPSFYDSSADTGHIQYPHFFIRLMRTREDIYSNRVVPPYGSQCETPVTTAPKAFEIIVFGSDGVISTPGNDIDTTIFQISKVQPDYIIRTISGNNIGSYIVDSVTKNASGPHTITVKNDLTINMPSILFQSSNREITFTNNVDLNTIEIGDIYTDASATSFNITAIDITNSKITIDGATVPDLNSGGKITRSGNVFKNTDPSLVRFLIMDPAQPVTGFTATGATELNTEVRASNPQIPLDAFYMVRIDSKDRDAHIEVMNRMWEEFSPPRSALPVLVRNSLSEEQALTVDITTGGSTTINIEDNSDYNVGDIVYLIDNLSPVKSSTDGSFPEPFKSTIVDIISTDQLVLQDTVPDTFTVENNARVISNAEFQVLMFHFQNHVTKDVEGAQYWVHEFMFWVQLWIDKLEIPQEGKAIQDISTPIEDNDSNIIFEDPC